ncbi:MAG: NrsF family protein [Acidovorax sp.]|jgi:hypothetical protein
MKTDDLIHALAAHPQVVDARAIEQRFALAALAGVGGAAVLMVSFYGLLPDFAHAMVLAMFWGKLLFAAALAAGGLAVVRRLARPGWAVGRTAAALAVPPLVLWALALAALALAAPQDRLGLVLGSTWRTCPFNIAFLSIPALAGSLWALRGAAPTRPALAGAAAGLLAGALGALVYALHCPEMAAPFLAVWYVAGMALPTLLGAVLGPRLLRW